MPYLPTSNATVQEFPSGHNRDLDHHIKMMEEQYTRHMPLINYYMLSLTPKVQGNDAEDLTDNETLVGDPGETFIDPLYLDSVPEQDDGQWTAIDPANPESERDRNIYHDPILINMRMQRISLDEQRKQTGDSELRVMSAFVPLSLLDFKQITIHSGDKLVWDGDAYRIEEYDRTGYWKNSNIRLYMKIELSTLSEGA